MKRILVVLAVAAMVVSSCGMKTNAQGEEAKDKAAVETTVEATVEAEAEKACCEKDSTAKECTDAEKKACCEKDSTAKECTDAEKKACCEKEVKDTEGEGENTEA